MVRLAFQKSSIACEGTCRIAAIDQKVSIDNEKGDECQLVTEFILILDLLSCLAAFEQISSGNSPLCD